MFVCVFGGDGNGVIGGGCGCSPKITEQFADLKRQLAEVRVGTVGVVLCCVVLCVGSSPPTHTHTHFPQVTASEWEAIPDIGDYTVKRQKRETFAPAPDSLLAAAVTAAGAAGRSTTAIDGLATPMGTASTVSNLTDIGAWACFALLCFSFFLSFFLS